MPIKTASAEIKSRASDPNLWFQIIIWVLTGILYYPVFKALYSTRWETLDYTHAYFILPVAIFLGWHALKNTRDSTLGTSTSPLKPFSESRVPSPKSRETFFFVSLFIFGLLTFIFGWRQDYTSVSTFSLLPVLFGLIGWLYGTRTVRILWFPIVYLLLLVPPPLGIIDSITLPMRYGVSIVTEQLVGLLHYPITRDGLMLQISGHEVFLGEACSGFRSLITLSSLGLAYIFISKSSAPRKFWMAAAIVPLALLGNLIRVVGVVIATYYLGETRGQQFFHDASGFVMFVVMLAGLLAIENFKLPGQRGSIKYQVSKSRALDT
jgi:exosortase